MKKKFRFKLESVEKVRRSKEQESLRLLATAQARYQQAVQFKVDLLRQTEESLIRRERMGESLERAVNFQLENDFIFGQKQRVHQADQFILRAKKNVEKQLKEYLFSRQQMRVIEQLRENAFVEFKKELQKKETKDLEDLYVMRARHMKESA